MENLESLKLIENANPLLHLLPEKNFQALLQPIHAEKPEGFTKRKPQNNEVSFKVVNLKLSFPDPENLLKFAYKDFKKFLKSANIKIKDEGKVIRIENVDLGDNVEKFILSVSEDECVIKTGTTQGVRRALIFIEDEMKRRFGPFLPLGEIVREPFIKTRISRCFFTPPSHAFDECNENELTDNIDYYPDEYLNRLAHDGINALWIGAPFRTLLKSKLVKEFGANEKFQIKKLNTIVKKCKKFGIGIYLFCTEPASTLDNKALLNHPEMLGPVIWDDVHTICPSLKTTRDYIEESVTRLFTLVPDLEGLINITAGESLSGCGSTSTLHCPKCKENFGSVSATMVATENMFLDAMKKVAPNAKFISWTYGHRGYNTADVIESCKLRNPEVIHMQNFEDLGRPVQLGKKRLAYDYWLSYAGPGELMKTTTSANKQYNKPTFAKIQVCSSHEISTVPYVPAPGILYDKYKYMHENGIEGVLQCWYFGNYPSMMNKGASELSYAPLFKTKKEFLIHLAKTFFGKDYFKAYKAWKAFEKGYINFPVNLAFEWVGPMQDSPCCPLHLLPVDHPMSGTWVNDEMSGDRIGECLLNGHTIDEAITLVGRMNKFWKQGLKQFSSVKTKTYSRKEQVSNATAIGLIFNSGYNVLKFYKLRHLLGTNQGNSLEILKELKQIVKEEIEISTNLIPICENDSRIGYHSEANGHKIFPAKLRWRIDKLNELLLTEFPLVEQRINEEKIPLEFYYGLNDGYTREFIQDNTEQPKFRTFTKYNGEKDEGTALRVYEDDSGCHIQIKVNHNDDIVIKPEFHIMFPTIALNIRNGKFIIDRFDAFSVPTDKVKPEMKKFKFTSKKTVNDKIYTLSFKRETLGLTENEPFRIAVYRQGETESTLVKATKYYAPQLIRSWLFTEHYCFFIKKTK